VASPLHVRNGVKTIVVMDTAAPANCSDAVVVTTPLDMIHRLESSPITTVVLATTAARRELASFLLETYPMVRVEEP
jgi:hypothetical protein